ncbi:uncharacterized protein B0H64DRAFT_432136 [Chaetomium fimeti]|uniref:Uncharacterized protein n=1 Tax=Chaetomium fimeti TaxID=1854472 RepID=A0AAE0HF77_9PEZI|nr:hypothetical protein B0H64DRAFT_432136 [Chaetomium fimeti]
MMFKATTVIALAAALAQAAAVDARTGLSARQDRPCPDSGLSCGWYLLGSGNGADTPCTTRATLEGLNGTVDVFDSIWRVEAGAPVAWVEECQSGCSNIGDRPSTTCNA